MRPQSIGHVLLRIAIVGPLVACATATLAAALPTSMPAKCKYPAKA